MQSITYLSLTHYLVSDAIAYLALGNQLNKTRLREAGALTVVMEALRGFCRSLVGTYRTFSSL